MYSRDVERERDKERENILSYGTCGTFLGHCGWIRWHGLYGTKHIDKMLVYTSPHICSHRTLVAQKCSLWKLGLVGFGYNDDFNLRSRFWKCQAASPILLGLAEGDTLNMVSIYESYFLLKLLNCKLHRR